MRKKICCLAFAAMLSVCIGSISYANTENTGSESSHMRIFTPHHSVKSVYKDLEKQDFTDCKRQLTDEEIKLIAGVVHAESKGEPFEGKIGVAAVILNRLYHPEFPKSVEGVIYQKNAFSCVAGKDFDLEPDKDSYEAVMEALDGKDPTNNAVFFYNPKTASSRWMINTAKDQTVTIGSHVFFK